ncbi:TPA_asm: RNA-directed RNA polymerase [ssRNA phage Gerhypos.3_27]|uniref:RNA-directed RNA polymerase n=2 Tax=Norzivirales TaxID=2842247 RepID=A0A8S5KYI1_9VIRU|nr:RNA-directed RNA polymerase [ssRNA phage Gerhypos.3_27]QDH87994.1 MAG: RNA-dependent RNA polymerase [Leviviridae sp.]DAD50191.1 TPA_asm: RNA-directed RNA polymerase [ssRNA phage Gerhypos.3_27]
MSYCPDVLYLHAVSDISRYREKSGMSPVPDLNEPFCSYEDALSKSLLSSIVKKFEPLTPDHDREEKAKLLFLSCNEGCKNVQLTDLDLVRQMRYLAYRELPALDWDRVLDNSRHGPGASVNSHGWNSSFEKFFVNQYTTTSGALYFEYFRYLKRYPSWRNAEFQRIALHDGTPFEVVACSNLSTVPKNDSIDRTICTEPALNMLFQLGLGEELNKVLRRRYEYDPALQPDRNRGMACSGSNGSPHCTIDLSSASDTISLELCHAILPSDWYAAILDCRSPRTRVDGNIVPLYMVSSMGNGFTFPLQTYIFSLMIRALCMINNREWTPYSKLEFGVFGDDIIVPQDLFEITMKGLVSLGFQPNLRKSFGSGLFRESCGTDWYSGRDVRGVYCRRLTTLPDRLSLANRLLRWSARHCVSVTNTIQYLLPSDWSRFTVPSDMPDTSGLKVPFCLSNRRNFKYQAFLPKRKVFRALRQDGNFLRTHDNPMGFLICAGSGLLRSDGLDRRQGLTRYQKTYMHSPFWDRRVDLMRYGISFADWETLCWINLTG